MAAFGKSISGSSGPHVHIEKSKKLDTKHMMETQLPLSVTVSHYWYLCSLHAVY